MRDRPQVDLYCEDSGHEQFVRALLNRIAAEIGLRPTLHTVSGRGGHGRAMTEFKAWQRAVSRGKGLTYEIPDLLVLVIDANCSGWTQVRRDLEQAVDGQVFSRSAIGCPDPHIERWCLADPGAIQEVLGISTPEDPGKCERLIYKQLLRQTIRSAGQPILTSEMEYAPDLVAAMDLFREPARTSLPYGISWMRFAARCRISSDSTVHLP